MVAEVTSSSNPTQWRFLQSLLHSVKTEAQRGGAFPEVTGDVRHMGKADLGMDGCRGSRERERKSLVLGNPHLKLAFLVMASPGQGSFETEEMEVK